MPDDTSAPVTAEGLRERLIARLDSEPLFGAAETVDALLAELAGVPGDLPARMAEAIDFATCKHIARGNESACGECRAAAAVSVYWEDNARTKAEVERLRAELAEARREAEQRRGELQLLRIAADPAKVGAVGSLVKHATRLVQIERDDARAERDVLKAAIEQARARLQTMLERWKRAQVADQFPSMALADVLAALDAPETREETGRG